MSKDDTGKPREGEAEADILPFPGPADRKGTGASRRGAPRTGMPKAGKANGRKPHGAGPGLAGDDESDLEIRMLRLASFGVAVEEIEFLCAEALEALGWKEEQIDEVVERGRCWGRAKVMEAQFAAAISGKVSAQEQILARLEGEEEPEPGEEEAEVAFVREVETERGEAPEEPAGNGAEA